MRAKRLGVACTFVFLAVAACQSSRQGEDQGIVETVDNDGFPVRLETEIDDDCVDDATLAARLETYTRERRSPEVGAFDLAPENFDPFIERGCPPEGKASSAAKQARNRLKNRTKKPTLVDIDQSVTLDALREPGLDRERWDESQAASIVVYIDKAFGTGKESCNCDATSKALTDTHIDVLASPDDTERKVIVEITPVWRLINAHAGLEDWSSTAVRNKYEGHYVRITGWLYFDESHVTGADNTDPENDDGEENWRATCWEIHPVTSIELVQ